MAHRILQDGNDLFTIERYDADLGMWFGILGVYDSLEEAKGVLEHSRNSQIKKVIYEVIG